MECTIFYGPLSMGKIAKISKPNNKNKVYRNKITKKAKITAWLGLQFMIFMASTGFKSRKVNIFHKKFPCK